MGHGGSSGVLIMLVSIVVLEKLPGQKKVTKKKMMNFRAFSTSFYTNPDMTTCNFFDIYMFNLWRTAH